MVMPLGGYRVFDHDTGVAAWAKAAHNVALRVSRDPDTRAANLRHGETWFVGVDALPSEKDGSINGVPLCGPWQETITAPKTWHPAQLSIVYPGYPKQDAHQTDANHRYRLNRHSAHVDGLLPIGPQRHRFLREPHAFILGLPLNISDAAPLIVWPGSQRIIGDALRALIGERSPTDVNLSDTYHAARRACFDQIKPIAIIARPGQSVLLHRHLLHGIAPWAEGASAPREGRIIAYFRPMISADEWLVQP